MERNQQNDLEEQLRELAKVERFSQVFKVLLHRKRNTWTTDLYYFYRQIKGNLSIDFNTFKRCFKLFETLGIGLMESIRGGFHVRFHWAYQMRSVGAVALEESYHLKLIRPIFQIQEQFKAQNKVLDQIDPDHAFRNFPVFSLLYTNENLNHLESQTYWDIPLESNRHANLELPTDFSQKDLKGVISYLLNQIEVKDDSSD